MVGIEEIKVNGDPVNDIGFGKYVAENSPAWLNIAKLAESCLVPGLVKPYDEYSEPIDDFFKVYSQDTEKKLLELNSVLNIIKKVNLTGPIDPEFVSSMFLLTEEMKTKGPWYDYCYSKYANVTIDWFQNNCNFCEFEQYSQKYKDNIFQICMHKIHSKLTKDKWKHHPASINCYRNVIKSLPKLGKVSCSLHLVFPVTLLQIDDYHDDNKIQGLKCCSLLLTNLIFSKTGYEEVIYDMLKHLLRYPEKSVLERALECTTVLLPIFSTQKFSSEWTRSDDIFEILLGDLYLENNLTKKAMYFQYLPILMELSGNSAIRWKNKIFELISDNIDIYLHSPINIHVVSECIKCLTTWLSIGWPVWNTSADSEILIRLCKLFYALNAATSPQRNKDLLVSVENCVILTASLCTLEERHILFKDDNVDKSILGENFVTLWNTLKNKVFNLP